MGDEYTTSPGQLRQFEENNGWLPSQPTTETTGTSTSGVSEAQPQQQEVKPMTMGRYTQMVSFNKGDYITQGDKLYYKDQDGNITHVTGDVRGDVEEPTYAKGVTRTTPEERKDAKFGGTFIAGNGDLCFYDANGTFNTMSPYTSGQDGVTDPSIPDKGPIPPGGYTFYTKDISEAKGLRYYLWNNPMSDWGHYRVPLIPDSEANTYGRSGIFLHGGSRPGSKGCVDAGGNDLQLFPDIQTRGGKYRLSAK